MSSLSKESLAIYKEYLEYFRFCLMQETLKHCNDEKKMIYSGWQFSAYEEIIKKLSDIWQQKTFYDAISWEIKNVK